MLTNKIGVGRSLKSVEEALNQSLKKPQIDVGRSLKLVEKISNRWKKPQIGKRSLKSVLEEDSN